MVEFIEQLLGDDFHLMVIRLFIALILSGLIGYEREVNNHSAGFRTHILVGVGSCLMMILSLFGFTEIMKTYDPELLRFDPARIPSYVISGIGFLGAGTIIVYGGTIRGLTTAASIWTVAGIGLVVGAGMYSIAIVTTIIILVSLIFFNQIEKVFPKYSGANFIEIVVEEEFKINEAVEIMEKYNFSIQNIEVVRQESKLRKIYIKTNRQDSKELIEPIEEISRNDYVKNISELNK